MLVASAELRPSKKAGNAALPINSRAALLHRPDFHHVPAPNQRYSFELVTDSNDEATLIIR